MTGVILDASALIAMIKNEPGAAKVAEAIGKARISAVNYAEVVSHFVHWGMPASEVDIMLQPLSLTVVVADIDLARIAGGLRGLTAKAGLSLGDRFCLALAVRDGMPAWTADKNWQLVAEQAGAEIVLIR